MVFGKTLDKALGKIGNALGTAINDQFNFGENSEAGLDYLERFDFIDKSAERSYFDDGFVRNIRPRNKEVVWQAPDITIVIKKRMFSSLADNFRLDLLEENEKLFYKASKRLFQNKCRTIAAYERLSKFDQIVGASNGRINSFLMPGIMGAITDLQNAGINLFDSETNAAIDTIRKVYAFSEPAHVTTWNLDNDLAFADELGEGAGTIDLTMVSNFSSTISTTFGAGSCSFSVENPQNMLRISNTDIDQAIADSDPNNRFNGSFDKLIQVETRNRIQGLKTDLNNLRKARGAGTISFIESPETLISKRLRVLVAERGTEINFTYNPGLVGLGSSVTLDDTVGLGAHALNSAEQRILKQIISDTFLLWGYQNTTRKTIYEWNTLTNYVRKKMRLHYAGKLIIQPMDIVNVFITTHTDIDPKLNVGMDIKNEKYTINQKINNLVNNINNFGNIESFEAGKPMTSDDLERVSIAGPDFPAWLWRIVKNDFTRQAAGTCVFVGLVDSAPRSFSQGKHTINVSCKDNTHYFSRSQINITPALDVWNGSVYDPLTPFNISFDAATGMAKTNLQSGQLPDLLPENKILLQTGAIQFGSGRWRGTNVTENLHKANDMEIGDNKAPRRVLHNPDGFVYRWKEGIEAITKTDRAYPVSSTPTQTAVRLTKNPFAGQDVMNVISLLVTGQPYNYNSFLRAAIDNAGSVSKDIFTNKSQTVSYIDGLVTELSKRNMIWGNFVPFKKLIMSDAADQFIRSGQGDLITRNAALNDLLQQKARLMDQLALWSHASANNPGGSVSANATPEGSSAALPQNTKELTGQLNRLNKQIAAMQQEFDSTVNKLAANNGFIKIMGDDFSFDPAFDGGGSSATTSGQKSADRAAFKKHMNVLTQRRLWKVRANEDKNLFVVDDQYDKSFDIQAFERAINGSMSLLSSEFVNVDSEIKKVAHILGLEIFADSQGHIQARPPQYNKVPSSVFFNMFKQRDNSGIKVFPEFLESLFYNQIQGLITAIENTENNIRLRGVALGLKSSKYFSADAAIANNISKDFIFLSDEHTGKIGNKGLQGLLSQANPNLSQVNEALQPLQSVIQSNLSATRLFDTRQRNDLLSNINFKASRSQDSTDDLYRIRTILRISTGQEQPTREQLFSTDKLRGVGTTDALKVINEISMLVNERQGLLRALNNAVKSLGEGIEINESNRGANASLFPALHSDEEIPPILEHMIEDESLHDFGPGSGGRFVIRDRDIISITIQEKAPDYCAVTVDGKFDSGDQGIGGFVDAPNNLVLNQQGGNAVSSAYAVDYDMWHMYGFNVGTTVPAPFFFNPDTQCAPYATFLLNLARRQILQGSVELRGNEYYQAGDVVYIEDEDLLFYVEQVRHGFNYNGQLTTSLELRYGHTPGEYIPTMLDIVGKILYNTRSAVHQFRNSRFEAIGADRPLGALMLPNRNISGLDIFDVQKDLLSGTIGQNNNKILNNILFSVNDSFSTLGSRKGHIEIRIYTNSLVGSKDVYVQYEADDNLVQAANIIKQWFVNPTKFAPTSEPTTGSFTSLDFQNLSTGVQPDKPSKSNGIPKENIKISIIDVSTDNLHSPSGNAWNAARAITNGAIISDESAETQASVPKLLAKSLYRNVIDIWQVFEDVDTTISASTLDTGQTNQAQQSIDNVTEQLNKKKAGIE